MDLRFRELVVGRAVEDAGVVDEDVDLAERSDQLRDAGQVSQVVDDVAGLLVQRENSEPALLEQRRGRLADALRGAGDENSLQTRPGMLKPLARSSLINVSS